MNERKNPNPDKQEPQTGQIAAADVEEALSLAQRVVEWATEIITRN